MDRQPVNLSANHRNGSFLGKTETSNKEESELLHTLSPLGAMISVPESPINLPGWPGGPGGPGGPGSP